MTDDYYYGHNWYDSGGKAVCSSCGYEEKGGAGEFCPQKLVEVVVSRVERLLRNHIVVDADRISEVRLHKAEPDRRR
jgi:hypothetical protein